MLTEGTILANTLKKHGDSIHSIFLEHKMFLKQLKTELFFYFWCCDLRFFVKHEWSPYDMQHLKCSLVKNI